MVNLFEMAMVAARDLPPEMQGDITRLILAYPGDELSPEPVGDDETPTAYAPLDTAPVATDTTPSR